MITIINVSEKLKRYLDMPVGLKIGEYRYKII